MVDYLKLLRVMLLVITEEFILIKHVKILNFKLLIFEFSHIISIVVNQVISLMTFS